MIPIPSDESNRENLNRCASSTSLNPFTMGPRTVRPIRFRSRSCSADHPEHGWRMEILTMASHTGSHLDAPLHKIAGGNSISDLPLETFCGPARIIDLRPLEPETPIGPELLEGPLAGLQPDEIVLLCTGWGEIRSHTEVWLRQSPFLSPEGAALAGRTEGAWGRHRPLLDRRLFRADQRRDAHDRAGLGNVGRRGASLPCRVPPASPAGTVPGAAHSPSKPLRRLLPPGPDGRLRWGLDVTTDVTVT